MDGLLLPPGAGHKIQHSMTLKVGADRSRHWSLFEFEAAPGFDVGVHSHDEADELFYILDGELDVLAFYPRSTRGDWRGWESATGARVARANAGSVLFVPSGCPHGFANPGPVPARLLFVTLPGHEHYATELAELLARPGPADQELIAAVRARHGIRQLTPMTFQAPTRPAELDTS